MNKIERVLAALGGSEVDRPPFSFWYHFGLQHMPGPVHAQAEIDFYRAYDLDFIKVMNDYPYPLPAGLDALESEDDWKRIEPVDGHSACWREQLTALSRIHDAVGNEALFIDTIFSPWTTARRLAPLGGLERARKQFPETVLTAMGHIATSLATFSREAVSHGASGIFLSLGAATSDVLSEEEYRTWCRPFDLEVLEAVKSAPFNVLHIHGKNIFFDSVLDYPANALNWSHYATAPSLKDGKSKAARTVLGGIDEANASHVSAPEIAEQVKRTIREIGTTGIIITPGCSIPTDTSERNMRAVKHAL
ncbi:MAG: uroporphyrinogen decarboxylase family protein [Blastocatellia bacterium]